MNHKWTLILLSLLVPLAGQGQFLPLTGRTAYGVRSLGKTRPIPIESIRYRRMYPIPKFQGAALFTTKTGTQFHSNNTLWTALQKNIERNIVKSDLERIQTQPLLVPLHVNLSVLSKTVPLPEQQSFQDILENAYREILAHPSEWNLRKQVELLANQKHIALLEEPLFLDVMSLELYMLKNYNAWPQMNGDPAIDELNKNIMQALWDDTLYPVIVNLRSNATNVPNISATVTETESFIKKYKRMPGVVYLNLDSYEDISPSIQEKNLGVDMQFLAVTNLGNDAKLSHASLAKLIDQWECYYVIALESGIPEREADGVANIPVYTKAQWQSRLMRWVYSNPIQALMHEPRSYEEILQRRQTVWNSQLANARKQASEEQVMQWWELMRPERESDLRFSKWNDFERSEALLYAAKSLDLQMPQLSHAEWDAYLQQWIERIGIPRSVILEGSVDDEIPVDALINGEIKIKSFKEMEPLEKEEEILGQLYYNHIYPEEYIARLREANEL